MSLGQGEADRSTASTTEAVAGPDKPVAVIVAHSFLDRATLEPVRGGSVRYLRDLAYLLRDLGFNVRIIQKGYRDLRVNFDEGIDIEILRVPLRAWADFIFAGRVARRLRGVALCVYGTPEAGFPFYARGSVVIQHGVWWDRLDYSRLKGAAIRLVQRVRNATLCRRARVIICVDTNYINYLRVTHTARLGNIAKCRYIPNYVDTAGLPAVSDESIHKRFAKRKLIFLRRLEPQRGALLFASVCRCLREQGVVFQATMVGEGSQRGAVTRYIAAHRLEDTVRVTKCDFHEVFQELSDSTISVIPSCWSEGTSLAAVESIGCGIPVVASDVGGLSNVIVPYHNGLIVPAEVEALAAACTRLLDDERLYSRLASNCVSMRDALSYERWLSEVREAIFPSKGLRVKGCKSER
jgi:glycosyltransferase involved in cell wall biosynthesis